MTSRCTGAVVIVAGAVVLAACTSSRSVSPAPSRSPAFASPPAGPTTSHCLLPDRTSSSGSHARVTVAADPVSVDAAWYPGLNIRRCTEPITHGRVALARRLARDIRNATPYPPGRYSCPADFGEAVQLYFHYAGQRPVQTVLVSLTGCASITAPGRDGMGLEPGRLVTDLDAITPSGTRAPG